MNRLVTIEGALGVRRLMSDDFPLTIGMNPAAHIPLPGENGSGPVAFVGLADGVPYVQPANRTLVMRQNGRPLAASSWLQDGDTLEIGQARIRLRIGLEQITFRVESIGPPALDSEGLLMPPAGRLRTAPMVVAPSARGGGSWHSVRLGKVLLLSVFGILLAAAWLVFTARFVSIRIEPAPDRLVIQGGLIRFPLADGYLLYPGRYRLLAEKAGYHDLAHEFTVVNAKPQAVILALHKLPGKLRIDTGALQGARVTIDGSERGRTPLVVEDLAPGPHGVLVQEARYLDLRREVVIEGRGVEQTLSLTLVPRWALVTLSAVPAGASLWVDGEEVGTVPITTELLAGTRELELRREGYNTWRHSLEVIANQPQTLPEVVLAPADGVLRIVSRPPGASVTIDRQYAGQTPVAVPISPKKAHAVAVSKAGYQGATHTATVEPGGEAPLVIDLAPITGALQVLAEPLDAELFLDGKAMGPASQRLSLAALPHTLEVRKQGYQTFRTHVTPRPGYPQVLKVRLLPLNAGQGTVRAAIIHTANGQRLRRIEPGAFTMGSSRREQGRRSNETLREVVLTRPFYLGVKEVTNRQYRQFDPSHYPEPFQGLALSGDDQPVVNVTWEQVAAYCNWLSTQESLPLVYQQKDGRLVAKQPLPPGYRLPTEAEWAWAARGAAQALPAKFPWGDNLPPSPESGNYADDSAATILANTLTDYHDGYPTTAPPGRFAANALGLYDLGGNVAEWTHDYYMIYPSTAGRVYEDPVGPSEGRHHVIRGSSWMHASISALRWTFRDYGDQQRPDVGFRIARNAE